MSLKQAIEKVLRAKEHTDLLQIVAAIRTLHPNKKSEKKLIAEIENFIWDEGITDIAIDQKHNRLVLREQLFSQTQFRIQPHPLDLEHECFIFGHRLSPFIAPSYDAKMITFVDESGKEIPFREVELPIEQAQQFVLLIAPYSGDYFEINLKSDKVIFKALDLRQWLKANPTSDKDMWMVKPLDYMQLRFCLVKLNSKQIAEQKLLIRRHDEIFKEALLDVLDTNIQPLPVDLSLFWAYARVENQSVVENPGSPMGPFVVTQEDWQVMFEGSYSYLYVGDYFDDFIENTLETAYHIDRSKMGKAKTINGIMNELGNNYNESFIAAKVLLKIHDNDFDDLSDITTILFPDERYGFYTDKQIDNFHKAYMALVNKVAKKWLKKRLSMQSLRLLGKIVQFKIEIVNALRDMGDYDEETQLAFFSSMIQFQPLDRMLDQMMDSIVWGIDLEPEDAKSMADKLSGSLEEFIAFKSNFFE